jgi:predicted Zn-dependent protease
LRNLRSPLLAVILLFAVLLLVAAPLLIRRSILPQPVADDNRLVEYNNPTLGFKLQRPEPWTVVEDHPQLIAQGQDMLHGVAFVPNTDEQKALVMVYVQTLTDTQTLQDYAAKQRADLEANAQVTSSALKPLTINGQAALETGAITSVSGEPLQYRLIMLINGQRAYALLYTGPNGGTSSERFQSMLDSFEFVR